MQGVVLMKMNKKNIKKEDGRNLYYYTFDEDEAQEKVNVKEEINNEEE